MEQLTKFFSSGYLIFLFLLLSAGVFVILYLIRFFVPLIFAGKINEDRFRKYFTVVEMAVWVMLLLTAAIFFLKHHIVFAAVLFLFLLLLLYWWSRFALRDYLAGLVFKIENRFALGEIIEVAGYKGKIKRFYARNLLVENENGKMILLPYSELMGVISSPQNISETVLNDSFELTVPADRSFEVVTDLLNNYILSLPWTVVKYEPRIKLVQEIDNQYIVKVTVFSFDESYFQLMQKTIRKIEQNDINQIKKNKV
ncbi:MAG: mechanosensitive ion channel, partial [Bacteroidales bacterium]|nr:mechanosensitive ion channel [Bacteroidales bacterium]